MTRDRIRMLTWMLAILVPATFALAAGIHATPPVKDEMPEGRWECQPVEHTPAPYAIQA